MLEAHDHSVGILHQTFVGIRFALFGFDAIKQSEVRSKLIKGGAVDVGQYSRDCTHVIVDKLVYDDPVCVSARCDGKTLVTVLWVDDCCDIEMLVSSSEILYRPVKDLNGIPGVKGLVVCLTGYQRQDRDDIMTMVGLMGAQFSKPLVANKVTHLVCYKFEGEKYELAKRLKKIKLVNHKWLEDCLKAWKILPEALYDKSGYELEIMQSEAKDSDEEAEGIATRHVGEREMGFGPCDTAHAVSSEQRFMNNIDQVKMSPSSASKGRSPSITRTTSLHPNNIKDKMPQTFELDDVVIPQLTDYDRSEKHGLIKNITANELPPNSTSAEGYVASDCKMLSAVSYIRKTPMKSMLPVSKGVLNNSPSLQLNKSDAPKDATVTLNGKRPSEQPALLPEGKNIDCILPQKTKEEADPFISKLPEASRDSTPYISRAQLTKKIHGANTAAESTVIQGENCFRGQTKKEVHAIVANVGNQKAPNTISTTKSSSGSKLSDIRQSFTHPDATDKMQEEKTGGENSGDNKLEPYEGRTKKPIVKNSLNKTLGSRSRVMAGRVGDRKGSLSSDKASIQSSNVLNPPVGANEASDSRNSLSNAFRLTSSSGSEEKPAFQQGETANEETETPEDVLGKTVPELDSAELINTMDGIEHAAAELARQDVPSPAANECATNEPQPKKQLKRKKQPASRAPKPSSKARKVGLTKTVESKSKTEQGVNEKNLKSSDVSSMLDNQTEKENMPLSADVSNNQNKVLASKCDEQKKNEKAHFLPTNVKPILGWFLLSGHRLQRKEIRKIITGLRGRCCRDSHQWSYQATHFIVPEPVRRTEKFFAAAASGRWILMTDYITASSQEGQFLPEENYEWHKKGLSEDGAINLEAPRKWRLLRERTGHGALYKLRVIIYGECIAPSLWL